MNLIKLTNNKSDPLLLNKNKDTTEVCNSHCLPNAK